MPPEDDPVRQIIAYQRQINRASVDPDQSPRELILARVRGAGTIASLLEITFDLWYPLITAFDIELKLPVDKESSPPLTDSRRMPALPLLDLAGANLASANFAQFDLIGLNMRQADLQETNLAEADLSWADLSGANLSDANLTGAQLFETDLRSACLVGANLTDTNLTGARYNRSTHWPAGFDPQTAGALLKD